MHETQVSLSYNHQIADVQNTANIQDYIRSELFPSRPKVAFSSVPNLFTEEGATTGKRAPFA